MSDNPTRRTRLGAAAGLLGAATAFTFIVGAGPAPSVFQLAGANEDISGNCDEAEHADDAECTGLPAGRGNDGSTSTTVDGRTSTTVDDSTSTTVEDGSTTTVGSGVTDPAAEVRSIDAAGAGTVLVAVDGGSLRLITATPAAGWRVEVEQAAGREVEVDFRSGSRRVQVNVELEDGRVRERVRVRDDADGSDIRTENGTIVRDDADDNSNRGPGSDDSVDDHNRGPGSDDRSDDGDSSGSSHQGADAPGVSRDD